MHGSASNVTTVENVRPPAIARAIGEYGGPSLHASAPPIASGSMPRIAVAIVISTGRRRSFAPITSASVRECPS